jgi:hypothetical protein
MMLGLPDASHCRRRRHPGGSTRRRQAARGWQSNERPNFPGLRSYFVMPQRRHWTVPRFWLELGAFVSRFRLFAQWLGYYRACQPELPTIRWQSNEWSVGRENCVVGIMTTCFVVNDRLAAKDKRSGGGLQQSMMAADFPRSLADTI